MAAIVMFVKEFAPLPIGGAEMQAERLAVDLARRKCPVVIITRCEKGLPAFEEKDGVQIVRVVNFGHGKLQAVTFVVGAFIAAMKLGRSFDIFHAHLEFSAAMAAVFAGRLLRKPIIVKYGSSGASSEMQISRNNLWGRFRLSLLRHLVDLHIVLTEEMEIELKASGFEPSRVIRMVNGVDADHFSPPTDKNAAKLVLGFKDKTVVLYVGRLVRIKSLPTLLSALKRAIDFSSELHLLVVGDGDEKQRLEEQVVQMGLKHKVTFTGALRDVRPHFHAADIFVLPSLGEGIANSLLEAMSCGLACIATRVGGSESVFDDGNCGILVEPGNVDQLTDALIKLSSSPRDASRLGMTARKRILMVYDFTAVGHQYFELYNRLLGAPS